MDNDYDLFIKSKELKFAPCGFDVVPSNQHLFNWQKDIVRWGLRKGRCAMYEDCGLGKTIQELSWSDEVYKRTGRNVLIVAPLAVSEQTVIEGIKFGFDVNICRSQHDAVNGINITNFEMLPHFDPSMFGAIVIDESSILKGDGPLRKSITEFASVISYRLAASATSSPNDYMELGNQAEFLGIMSKSEMLAMFFYHDGGDTSKWRLKGHAVSKFWEWVASWAVVIRKPSDIGYSDEGFVLPPIKYHQHTVAASWETMDTLFPVEAETLQERNAARRGSLDARVRLCADLVNASDEEWVIWCNLNDESALLAKLIPGAVEVTGSDSPEFKKRAAVEFANGPTRVLVSKGSIFGFGMNFQRCRNVAFVGLSDSWETVYQATRRCWRFGQKREVHCHFITGELEGAVVRNIQRKEEQADEMFNQMTKIVSALNAEHIHGTARMSTGYNPSKKMQIPSWMKGTV